MRRKYKRIFVCTERDNSQSGITYFSILFHLVILLMMVPFFGLLYQSIESTSYHEELAVIQCFQFIQEETQNSLEIIVNENMLEVKNSSGEYTSISFYRNVIRRQVSNQGHEVLLRQVESIRYGSKPYGFSVIIKTMSGETYEKEIFTLTKQNG